MEFNILPLYLPFTCDCSIIIDDERITYNMLSISFPCFALVLSRSSHTLSANICPYLCADECNSALPLHLQCANRSNHFAFNALFGKYALFKSSIIGSDFLKWAKYIIWLLANSAECLCLDDFWSRGDWVSSRPLDFQKIRSHFSHSLWNISESEHA